MESAHLHAHSRVKPSCVCKIPTWATNLCQVTAEHSTEQNPPQQQPGQLGHHKHNLQQTKPCCGFIPCVAVSRKPHDARSELRSRRVGHSIMVLNAKLSDLTSNCSDPTAAVWQQCFEVGDELRAELH